MLEPVLAVLGFVVVAVITPGPNNFVVLAAAARGGIAAAVPAIAGVIAGSLLLVALVWAGAEALFAAWPGLQRLLLAAGALYLAWLGALLVWQAGAEAAAARGLPRTALGLTAFQLLNPKAWVLVLTATTAMLGIAAPAPALLALAAMFTIVPCLCLLLWASAGALIAQALKRPATRRRFDRAMGLLLIACAALLLA